MFFSLVNKIHLQILRLERIVNVIYHVRNFSNFSQNFNTLGGVMNTVDGSHMELGDFCHLLKGCVFASGGIPSITVKG